MFEILNSLGLCIGDFCDVCTYMCNVGDIYMCKVGNCLFQQSLKLHVNSNEEILTENTLLVLKYKMNLQNIMGN